MRIITLLILTLLCVLGTYAVAERALEPARQKLESLDELRAENAKVAEEWFQAVNRDYLSGTVTLADVYEAATAKKDAGLAVAKSKDERLAILKKHVDVTENIYDKVEALHKSSSRGGEMEKLERSRYSLLSAKIQYQEESAKK